MEYDKMYPASVRRMMPYLDEAIDTYGGNLTADSLNSMTSHLVSRSGATMDPPPSANDFARWLILMRLAEESGLPFFPYYPFLPPFGFFPSRRPRGRR